MDTKLAQTRLVENELGRLIERTQVGMPKQQLLKSFKPKRDRKGKGKEGVAEGVMVVEGGPGMAVAVAEGAAAQGPLVGESVALNGGHGGEMSGIVSEAGGGASASTTPVEPLALPPSPSPLAPLAPAPFFFEEPVLMGPSAAQLLARADAEGLGVVNYRRRGRAG